MQIKNYYLKITITAFVVLGAYLYFSHAYIYYKIGFARLKASDDRHVYIAGNTSTAKNLVYVSLGDSLTAGVGTEKYEESYPYLLAEKIAGNDKTVVLKNFSYPGARTGNLMKDLLAPAILEKPDIVSVLIGINDIHGNVSASEFKKNYDYILKRLTENTEAEIYLISIPSIGSNTLILPPYNYYYDLRIKKFNNIIKELAADFKVKYIDLSTPTEELLKKDGPHYGADSFHPSAEGYRRWAQLIYVGINK